MATDKAKDEIVRHRADYERAGQLAEKYVTQGGRQMNSSAAPEKQKTKRRKKKKTDMDCMLQGRYLDTKSGTCVDKKPK